MCAEIIKQTVCCTFLPPHNLLPGEVGLSASRLNWSSRCEITADYFTVRSPQPAHLLHPGTLFLHLTSSCLFAALDASVGSGFLSLSAVHSLMPVLSRAGLRWVVWFGSGSTIEMPVLD